MTDRSPLSPDDALLALQRERDELRRLHDEAVRERASLLALAERRAGRLQKIQEIGALLARSLDEETILRTLAQELETTVPFAAVAVFSTTTSGDAWTRIYRHGGIERDTDTAPKSLHGLARAIVATRRPHSEPGRVAVPFVLAGSVLGVIVADTRGSAELHADDLELLRTVAAQVASAVSNARAYAESLRQQRQTEALADVARAVGESLRLEQVLRLILGHATTLLRTDGACIALLRGDALEVVAAIGTGDPLVGMWMPLVGSMTGRAVRTGTSIVGDASTDPDAFPPTVTAAFIRNVIIVPLSTANGPVGALTVFNRSAPFTPDAADVLQRFADQVAVAVVNARLFEDVTASRALAERHQRVVETSSDAIVITDTEHRIAFANPSAIAFFGYGDALIGMPVTRTIPDDTRDVRASARGRGPRGHAAALRGRSCCAPTAIDASWPSSTAPLREQGVITGIVASLRDITEERRARDAVSQSEARYRNLFESASDSIYTTDLRGTFTSVNEATVADVRSCADVAARPQLAHAVRRRARARARGRAVRARLRRRSGPIRMPLPSRRRRAPPRLRDQHADSRMATEVVGVLGVARDVTDERESAAALARSEARYTFGSSSRRPTPSSPSTRRGGSPPSTARSNMQWASRAMPCSGRHCALVVDARDVATARGAAAPDLRRIALQGLAALPRAPTARCARDPSSPPPSSRMARSPARSASCAT